MPLNEQQKKDLLRLISENPQQAIKRIKNLEAEDLESLSGEELFDKAVYGGQLNVANAIIERYALVTNDSNLKKLKPLAIDYDESANNTGLYKMNRVHCVSPVALIQYKYLVGEQKDNYLNAIKEETKKLRIMGIEKLLEVTRDPHKKALSEALETYKGTIFISDNFSLIKLQKIIDDAANSVSMDDKNSTTYKKAMAATSTAAKLDRECELFRQNRNHYVHPPLEDFQRQLNTFLNAPSNNILKESRGFGEAMAAIGNAISRYTGIGYLIAATQGKFQEFHEFKWKFFNEKTESETQQENIGSKINPQSGG
ncbi:TPA: hypothetical protein ACTXXA_002264 [Legionella anisa]